MNADIALLWRGGGWGVLAYLPPRGVDLVPLQVPLVVGGFSEPVTVYRREAVHVSNGEEVAQGRSLGQVRRFLGHL